jgi:magnesium-transporting ATPase (P-type)
VPADLRLVALKTATLRAEQSSLTGEPVAVLKGLEPAGDAACELQVRRRARPGPRRAPSAVPALAPALAPALTGRPSAGAPRARPRSSCPSPAPPPAPLRPQAKECMMFAGSAVASGAGVGVVTATGMATEIGKIQSDIQVGVVIRNWCELV